MKKKFESASCDGGEVVINDNSWGVLVGIRRNGETRQATTIAKDTAPALALAILEAAGVEATDMPEDPTNWNDPEALESLASWCLRQSIELKARATAEAKEQAKLEAEALAFYKASCVALGDDMTDSFHALTKAGQTMWLAVARKARELAKEATK